MNLIDSAADQEEGESDDDDLREFLLEQLIPPSVWDALEEEKINKEEIITYNEQDLIDLSNHLNLNVVIGKRFINVIKSISNAASYIPKSRTIVTVILSNEEKPQIKDFDTMIKSIKQNISGIANEFKLK